MCGLYDHRELLIAITERGEGRPWEVADCFMCLLCTPPTPLHRCAALSRREEHTESQFQSTVKYSTVHGACAVGNTDLLAWLPEHFPSVLNTCRGGRGEVSAPWGVDRWYSV